MGYATITDVRRRITEGELIRLTDEDDTGAVDEDQVASALESADIEIDSYLARRYPLPLAEAQPLLVTLAVDIAIWNLYGIVDHGGVPEVRKQRYDAAVATLRRLADGRQTLGVALVQAGSEAAVYFGPERRFGRDRTGGL